MSLEIIRATSAADLRRFIDVPWHIYNAKDHPQWIPPLRLTVKEMLDRRRPFYRDAERELFIAVRDGKLVGRIAAIENRAHNAYHKDKVGFWGFFESIDDQAVTDALFNAVRGWLRGRGLDVIRGPVMPSTNYDCGLLIEGFQHEPSFMTPWNPASYPTLVEGAGNAKVKDLVAYFIPMADPNYEMPPVFAKAAERARTKSGMTFRDIDLSQWNRELERFWDVYNAAWEDNWGFIPMSKDEFIAMAKDLKPLLLPQFAFMAEVDGKPAGFLLIVPDFNQIMKRIPNGKLFPTGAIKLLLGKKKLRSGRIMALGIKREFRNRSIMPLFFHESFRRGREYGAVGAEASWMLEDNDAMLSPLRAAGLHEYRRWRIYDGPTTTP